jgi:uncharacterized protein YkwD
MSRERWIAVAVTAVVCLAAAAVALVATRVESAHEGLAQKPRKFVPSQAGRATSWRAYLAPESVCPGRDRTDLPVVEQDQVMVCLLSYARAREGLPALPVVYLLNRSSALKGTDIVRCSDFSHTACGKPFPSVFAEAGYHGPTATAEGENLAWGAGAAGSPLAVVSDWLNSPHHRENLFSRAWSEQGVALVQANSFLGAEHVQIWVNEFGSRS